MHVLNLVPCFTDSGFSCSGFYRLWLFMLGILLIPAFDVGDFTDHGFFSFRVFSFLVSFAESLFLVLQVASLDE